MKLKILLPIFSVIMLTAGLAIGLNNSTSPENTGAMGLTYHGVSCVYINDELLECSDNLFTHEGMNFTMQQLSGLPYAATTSDANDLAIGNKTGVGCAAAQAATDSALCGEYTTCGLDRGSVANTFTRLNSTGATSGNWTIGGEWTATGSCEVNATGVFNTTTTGEAGEILFAENTFTTASLSTNDKINVTWYIWVT